jgi:hypothetical protein
VESLRIDWLSMRLDWRRKGIYTCRTYVGKPLGRHPLCRPRRRWDIDIYLKNLNVRCLRVGYG